MKDSRHASFDFGYLLTPRKGQTMEKAASTGNTLLAGGHGADLFAARNLIGFLSTDTILTPNAHSMRETALVELPHILPQFNLNEIAIDQLCAAYMMCSYGTTQSKHSIKPVINAMLRREMLEFGIEEIPNAK